MKTRILIFAIIFAISISYTRADDVGASAEIDTNGVLIGDQISLILKFRAERPLNVITPVFPDTIENIEIVAASKIDTLADSSSWTISQKFVITSFDSGVYNIPPFVFLYEKPGFESVFPAQTDPITLKFNTVAVDTTKPIKDIKPIFEEPLTFWEVFQWILLIIILFGAGLIIYFYIKGRRKKEPERKLNYDPKIPPHVQALEELKRLRERKLWEKGEVKQYHIELTNIVRFYIFRRFEIDAPDMITSEIIAAVSEEVYNEKLISRLRRTLELADLVKFAKYKPLPDENDRGMSDAIEFVNNTIPVLHDKEEREAEE